MAKNPNINPNLRNSVSGMNMDNLPSQQGNSQWSYALNGAVENFDQNSLFLQNEPGNELCLNFPTGYSLIGKHYIQEQRKHIFFLVNPSENKSEIGFMQNNDCIYKTIINADCLNFNIDYPIHKVVHKTTNCSTEIYWTDAFNPRRFLDLNNLPYKLKPGIELCDAEYTEEIDCNKLNVQPSFSIPQLEVKDIISGGEITAGTVQFAFQYSNASGDGYTSYYSVTNPTPIADPNITTSNFNYPVGKSIVLSISDIDISGYFQYFNIAVIKTVNNITSVELVGTYFIDNSIKEIIYSGQNQTQIRLTIQDIFEKYPYYEIAEDLTTVQDVIVWKDLTSIDRINLQKIANQISLEWETYRIPSSKNYSDELLATNYRGYLRDEIYPFEFVPIVTGGKQLDGFHIPGRERIPTDYGSGTVLPTNPDFIGEPDPVTGGRPYWDIYNTAKVVSTNANYTPYSDYEGSYQIGQFAYWESVESYPCNEDIWGDLAGKPIRHHKFPDVNVSPIFENPTIQTDSSGKYINLEMQKNAFFPIGVRINIQQIKQLIQSSDLTQAQKDSIIGFKIVRGDRVTNKSIVAKGILRNVGKYTREGTDYYFPNYPYNDLKEDPFILSESNAYFDECSTYKIDFSQDSEYQYRDCKTNSITTASATVGESIVVCSLSKPVITSGEGLISDLKQDTYQVYVFNTSLAEVQYVDSISGNLVFQTVYNTQNPTTISVKVGISPSAISSNVVFIKTQSNVSTGNKSQCYPEKLNAFSSDESKYRHVFNSPETSFGQPFLGDILKIENVIFGAGNAHYVQVKNNALYKFITKEAQEQALRSSEDIANITSPFSSTAMFTAYQSYLQTYLNSVSRKNYAWSYNSILDYSYFSKVDNGLGIKQRTLDISQYLIPGIQNTGDDLNINNYQRETSIYLKTNENVNPLPFPNQTDSLYISPTDSKVEDRSRYVNSEKNCSVPEQLFDISSVCYYGSIKNNLLNQWGQIYSYETIDTGFQRNLDTTEVYATIFGGDTFIGRFSFKTKLPFFIDNRVNAPDDSDVFYDEIGNIAYPAYWHSSRSILYDYTTVNNPTTLKNIISVKVHNFDCSSDPGDVQGIATTTTTTTSSGGTELSGNQLLYDGKIYLFAYGIPTFYVETSINIDLRQAFNSKEGDFYPHASSGIPDDWLQEKNVPIVQDNTYFYNVTYSKQNKENLFTHLPIDWVAQQCFTKFPFRAIYSEQQESFVDNRINNWLIYRPTSFFDFPQNYGKLTSLDGIDNRQVLARFENKALLYNALYTTQTNTAGQVYLGQSLFSKTTPPYDFVETDLGYLGSQHKFLLKLPQGQLTIDAKRGQIFIISGNSAKEISGFGSGLNRFLTDHLPFEILNHFPSINIDNHYKDIGLHGVYDTKYDRVIITKLDYIPLSDEVKYDSENKDFYIEDKFGNKVTVFVTDRTYFCNKSWTLSFNLNTGSWISFHTYLPNFYVGDNNLFYSGLNQGCDLEAIVARIPECTLQGTATQIYTYRVYDVETDGTCSIFNPVEYWSYTFIPSAPFAFVNGGAVRKRIIAFTHTNFTNELTSYTVTDCDQCLPLDGTAVEV